MLLAPETPVAPLGAAPLSSARPAGVLARLHSTAAAAGRAHREQLRAILELDRHDVWEGRGHRNLAEFLAAHLNISKFKARRRIGAAYAIECLPQLARALEAGTLSLDTVVELTRFATPDTEAKLIKWARKVTTRTVMARADEETRRSRAEVKEVHDDRYVTRSLSADGLAVRFEGQMPVAEGEVFFGAVDALARRLPSIPREGIDLDDELMSLEQRRVDALVMLAESKLAADATPMRPAMVVHAPVEVVTGLSDKCGSIAKGPAIPAASAARLACDARIEISVFGEDGLIGVGKPTDYIPPWLRRAVLRRDSHACSFSGCEMKEFVQVHHINPRCLFGPTEMNNLITVCTTHHKLIHEGGWGVKLEGDVPVWIRPNGERYEPGPALPDPPAHRVEPAIPSLERIRRDAAWLRFIIHKRSDERPSNAAGPPVHDSLRSNEDAWLASVPIQTLVGLARMSGSEAPF